MKKQPKSAPTTLEEVRALFEHPETPISACFDAALEFHLASGGSLEDTVIEEIQAIFDWWEKDGQPGGTEEGWQAAINRRQGAKPKPVDPYTTPAANAAQEEARCRLPVEYAVAASGALTATGKRFQNHNLLTLAHALAYADSGLHAIDGHALDGKGQPTDAAKTGKVPRGAKWEQRASTCPDAVIAFWTGDGKYPQNSKGKAYRYPDATSVRNVSIVFPADCGLFVLDIDGEEGKAALATLEAEHGPLPKTWKSETGSGGLHLIFKAEGVDIRNTASEIAVGVDIRGKNGQIVAPPSVHPSGNFYRWADGCAPWERDVAEAPGWLRKLSYDASKGRNDNQKHTKAKKKKTKHKTASGAKRASSGNGWQKHLKYIGDGEGQKGFHNPIRDAANAYFRELGTDTDDDLLKAALRDTIDAAHRDPGKGRERYDTEEYLDERVEGAREYIAVQGEAAEDEPFDITAPLGDTLGEALDSLDRGFRYVNIGGEGRFIRHLIPGEPPKLEVWTTTSLANWYADRKVAVATFDEDGNIAGEEEINAVPIFFNQAPRWDGTAFAPFPAFIGQNTYNLFRGFTVQPEPGDCTLLKEFIRDVICDGDESDFKWLWHWMAHLVQRPGEKPKTALVIWGDGGIGKGTFGRLLRALVHPYGTTFGDADAVVGRWSGQRHALNLVCVSEEAVFSGDRRVANALKHKVDHEECDVEVKNIQPITMPSYSRYVFDSNHPDAINIEGNGSERRYYVRRVSDCKKGDIEYFKQLREEIDGEGIKALLHELENYDPADAGMEWSDVFMAPETHDRKKMERETMRPVYRAYAQMIEDGEFLHQDGMEKYRFDLTAGQTVIPKSMLNAFTERFADSRQAAETEPSRVHERLYGVPLQSRRARCKCYYRRSGEHEAEEWVEKELNVQCYALMLTHTENGEE